VHYRDNIYNKLITYAHARPPTGGLPFVAYRSVLFIYMCIFLDISQSLSKGPLFLHKQREVAPCHGDKTQLAYTKVTLKLFPLT